MQPTDDAADLPHSSHQRDLELATTGLDTLLQEMTQVVATMTDPPLACGITVRRDGLPLTVAASDPRASRLDESQYVGGEGPCLRTLADGTATRVPDLRTEVRWPRYTIGARREGLVSSLSLPLIVGGTTVGAVNLYHFGEDDALTAEVTAHAVAFAAQAATALQLGLGRLAAVRTRHELEQAMASRTTIDQAVGILMGQQRCTAAEAFDLLRQRSQRSNDKLRDVAAELITRVTGRPPQEGAPFDVD